MGGGLEGGVATGRVAGHTDAVGVDIIQVAGLGEIPNHRKGPVAFLGGGAGTEGGAGKPLGVGVDGDDHDAPAGQLQGNVGLGLLGALEARNHHHGRSRCFRGGGEGSKKVGCDPLTVFRWQQDGLHANLAPGALDSRGQAAGQQNHRQTQAEISEAARGRGRTHVG